MSPIVHIINMVLQMILGLVCFGWILYIALELAR